MRRRSLIAVVLCCTLALALGLVGCGGGAEKADPVAESKAAFTGTWDLSGMVENGEPVAQEDLDIVKSLGLEIYLELDEDGSAMLELAGSSLGGEWTPKTATEADISFDDETITMTIDGDTLSMEQDGSRLEFTKRNESASASSS
ncbi:MAG: hypothetical protein J5818_02965 [Eggerthellaceae bacterium]|nr:hypothetical protein [Eggerthellaceae bacterium]